MSGGREPGSLSPTESSAIDEGTSARILTPTPGPLGWLGSFSEAMVFLSTGTGPSVVKVPLFAYGLPGGRIPIDARIDPGPAGLIEVNLYGLAPEGRQRRFRLTPATVAAFLALRASAKAAGFDEELFTIESAYRSAGRQRHLAGRARHRHGSEAGRWVAQRASEHVTGRTIDFNLGMENDSDNVDRMRETDAWLWLKDNAPLFGFSPYDAEPWHWSYNPIG
jgi:D-alanyl-D-alanine carboxypeptidase